jgi:hypothetical protein
MYPNTSSAFQSVAARGSVAACGTFCGRSGSVIIVLLMRKPNSSPFSTASPPLMSSVYSRVKFCIMLDDE